MSEEASGAVAVAMPERVAATPRGRRTAGRILDATVELLREPGDEGASMRAIAERAGVSVGNAYHYFPSKAHLVAAIYERLVRELADAAHRGLRTRRTLEDRLRIVWALWIQRIEPYHGAIGSLFGAAADPSRPLDPLGADSAAAREAGIELYRAVTAGSSSRIPAELRDELPALLWAVHVGVTLFWVRDRSPGRRRTARLIETAPDLLARVLALAGLPGFADLRRRAAELSRALLQEPAS